MAQMKIIVFLELCCGRKNASFVTHGVAFIPSAPNGGGFPLRGLTPRGFAASLLLFVFALRVLICGVRRRRRRLTARWAGRVVGSFWLRGDCCIGGVFWILVFR